MTSERRVGRTLSLHASTGGTWVAELKVLRPAAPLSSDAGRSWMRRGPGAVLEGETASDPSDPPQPVTATASASATLVTTIPRYRTVSMVRRPSHVGTTVLRCADGRTGVR